MKLGQEIRQRLSIKPWDRHGLILMTAGVGYIYIGVTFLFADDPSSGRANLKHALAILSYEGWCVVFMVVGAIAALASLLVLVSRTAGYTVLTGWTAFWAGVHIVGGLSYPLDLNYVALGLVWALLAFLWWAVSGLLAPPRGKENDP